VSEPSRRDEFLIAMYNQLMNDINRHIVIIWQSIGTLVAAAAAFGFVEKQILSIDVAASIVLATVVWMLAHIYDASHWYNRNLVIIANIERQFLLKEDLKEVHYYFGKHRPKGAMISHLRIQKNLGLSIALIVLVSLAYVRLGAVLFGTEEFSVEMCLPWLVAAIGIWIWVLVARDSRKKYEEFLRNSPGRDVNTEGIAYEVGHGHSKINQ